MVGPQGAHIPGRSKVVLCSHLPSPALQGGACEGPGCPRESGGVSLTCTRLWISASWRGRPDAGCGTPQRQSLGLWLHVPVLPRSVIQLHHWECWDENAAGSGPTGLRAASWSQAPSCTGRLDGRRSSARRRQPASPSDEAVFHPQRRGTGEGDRVFPKAPGGHGKGTDEVSQGPGLGHVWIRAAVAVG